ncbi:MAG: hypothetical protein WCE38_16525 [Burkholderiales bacterium]
MSGRGRCTPQAILAAQAGGKLVHPTLLQVDQQIAPHVIQLGSDVDMASRAAQKGRVALRRVRGPARDRAPAGVATTILMTDVVG